MAHATNCNENGNEVCAIAVNADNANAVFAINMKFDGRISILSGACERDNLLDNPCQLLIRRALTP